MSKVLASSIYSCPSLMLQHAAVKSLEEPYDVKLQKDFQKNMFQNICEYCKEEFKNLKLKVSDSKSAWYILIDFDYYKNQLENKNINNSNDLSTELSTSIGFITVSGSAFGLKNKYVLRYSLVDIKNIDINNKIYNIDNIKKGIDELKNWLNKLC